MKVVLICLSLMMLWTTCVSEEVTEVDPQQVRNIVAYGVPESQGYHRQSTPFYKPGISNLKNVGGVNGLLLLGLPSGKYGSPVNRHPNREYLPQGQNQYGQDLANHNPYDQSQFDQRPFISQSPFPYSNGQKHQNVMGNPYSRIPSWVGYPFPHRPLNNYNPSFNPGYVSGYKYGHNPGVRTVASRPVFYKPGVKDLKRYGGVEGLLRIGLPSAVLNQ